MSVPLPIINMAAYAVGQGGAVTLDQAKQTQPSSAANSTDKAHIRVYNDSGSHLQVWMDTGDLNEYLPAGGWLTWAIDQTANEFHWNVVNILPNPPVNLMFITYYKQGEEVPQIPTLGNSPIGGAVGTNTALTSTLSNEGNPPPTLVIDIGDTNFSQLVVIYNDGSAIWAVDQAGVKHQAWRVNNVGNPFQLGQTGDTSEVLGQLKVDQLATLTGLTNVGALTQSGGAVNIVGNGAGSIHLGAIASGDIFDTTGGSTYIKNTSNVVFQIPSGTTIMTVAAAGMNMNNLPISCSRVNLAQSGWDHLAQFTGGGNGTFGTGLSVAPSGIYTDPTTVSGSSQTIGFTIATSSVVTTGAGIAWFGQAIH